MGKEFYFGWCFIRPSGVPGHSNLSPHLHSKSLLLLKLLFLQNGATIIRQHQHQHQILIFTYLKCLEYLYKRTVALEDHTQKKSANVLIPELCFEFGESRPLAWVVRPAFSHQAVEGGRAMRRHSQSLAVLYPANHVIVLHPLERLDAVHQDLPHAHTYRNMLTIIEIIIDTS